MPTPTFQPPQGQQSTAQLQDWIIKLVRDLNYLLENLDTVNINRLDAKVIIAQTITALQIAAGTITANEIAAHTITANQIAADTITSNEIAANAITASEIAANAVTAVKIFVSQLSAISADIGTITAGTISSNATINVGTDLHVGGSAYLNPTNLLSTYYLTPSIYIYADIPAGTLHLVAPNGVYANSKRIDI